MKWHGAISLVVGVRVGHRLFRQISTAYVLRPKRFVLADNVSYVKIRF